MQKMGMEVDDAVRQFGGQHERLPEAAKPVAGGIAPEVAPPCGERGAVPGKASRVAPLAQDAQRFVMQVLGQVDDGRPDFGVDRMDFAVRRMAQREERETDAAPFERAELLGDEGLRQARIPLEDHCDDAGRERTFHPVSDSAVCEEPHRVASAFARTGRIEAGAGCATPREDRAGGVRCYHRRASKCVVAGLRQSLSRPPLDIP